MMDFYIRISQMEPMLPLPPPPALEELAVEIIRESARLGAMLHPLTKEALSQLFREMNCYYSNLIEGHKTSPLDIQKALKQDFSKEPSLRTLQQESLAHIQVQKLIEARLKNESHLAVCSHEFICWIHQEFYKRLPENFRVVNGDNSQVEIVEPGKLRNVAVQVGHHIPPHADVLINFLERFQAVYEPNQHSSIIQVLASAASHHRLAWIHPFLDGNGRVVRLFSDAYFSKIGINGHGLWTISRGLARHRAQYMAALASADATRQGDLDGRGNLSMLGLVEFCKFFLETAIDQMHFISTRLQIDGLEHRMLGYVNYLASLGKLKPQAAYVLKAALLQGEVKRGEVAHLIGMKERSASAVIRNLLDLELLTSTSAKGPLRLGFPIEAVQYYFPALYSSD